MLIKKTILSLAVTCFATSCLLSQTTKSSNRSVWAKAVNDPSAARLARPSKVQYNWQEMQLGMFVQLDPATIQEGEYDNGSTKVEDIHFDKLDVHEWCKAAKAFGAKEIVFMLAHSGGFCMWPSSTTQYHIGNTPYKGGNGDVVEEFAKACRKSGLHAGFYFWAPHPSEKGLEKNTVDYNSKVDKVVTREESNHILKTRFNEIVDRLGSDLVSEIWIDQPIKASIGKEIAQRTPNAVVFAVGCHDPLPTIRWPGTETGTVKDPCWSTIKRAQMEKVCASQYEADANQKQDKDDPDGDYWAPHEADSPLHEHFWHFRPDAVNHRKTVDELMNCYIQSVGRNSFFILNCAPMADGAVNADDMKRYQEFGQEINRRFGHPVALVQKVAGTTLQLQLSNPATIAYTDLWEAYQYGQRIRGYEIMGRVAATGEWVKIASGTSVGHRKIDPVSDNRKMDEIKLVITSSVGTPLIRKFQIHE
jgi:alpha-L-fucosidase